MCPWRVFEEPIVIDVLRVHKHWDKGQATLVLGDATPDCLIEGVEDFDGAYNACEHDRYQRTRPKPPPAGSPKNAKR